MRYRRLGDSIESIDKGEWGSSDKGDSNIGLLDSIITNIAPTANNCKGAACRWSSEVLGKVAICTVRENSRNGMDCPVAGNIGQMIGQRTDKWSI